MQAEIKAKSISDIFNFCMIKRCCVKERDRVFFLGTLTMLIIVIPVMSISAQSLNIPSKYYGLSVGNSKEFTGVRFNFRDNHVREINGLNFTLWKAGKQNTDAVVNGISVGIIPSAGYLKGIQLGIVGVAAEYEVKGISIGLLGAGSGKDLSGIGIGGLGIGSGGSLTGIFIGGLGAGAGGDVKGIVFGGLGAGAGGNMTGISLGILGAGAGGYINGIVIGGLGAGTGASASGILIGGLGVGTGEDMTGIVFGGVGAGCGKELKGVAIGGLGVGAPIVKGLVFGGFGTGGQDVQGVMLSGFWNQISSEGSLTGLSASAFNLIKGNQTGISLGIVNYTWHLNGFQIGLINYVKDNPKFLKLLPIINAHFD